MPGWVNVGENTPKIVKHAYGRVAVGQHKENLIYVKEDDYLYDLLNSSGVYDIKGNSHRFIALTDSNAYKYDTQDIKSTGLTYTQYYTGTNPGDMPLAYQPISSSTPIEMSSIFRYGNVGDVIRLNGTSKYFKITELKNSEGRVTLESIYSNATYSRWVYDYETKAIAKVWAKDSEGKPKLVLENMPKPWVTYNDGPNVNSLKTWYQDCYAVSYKNEIHIFILQNIAPGSSSDPSIAHYKWDADSDSWTLLGTINASHTTLEYELSGFYAVAAYDDSIYFLYSEKLKAAYTQHSSAKERVILKSYADGVYTERWVNNYNGTKWDYTGPIDDRDKPSINNWATYDDYVKMIEYDGDLYIHFRTAVNQSPFSTADLLIWNTKTGMSEGLEVYYYFGFKEDEDFGYNSLWTVHNKELYIFTGRKLYSWNGKRLNRYFTDDNEQLPDGGFRRVRIYIDNHRYQSLITYKGELYFLGIVDPNLGRTSGSINEEEHIYLWQYKWDGKNWKFLQSLPNSFYRNFIVLNDSIHLIGSTENHMLGHISEEINMLPIISKYLISISGDSTINDINVAHTYTLSHIAGFDNLDVVWDMYNTNEDEIELTVSSTDKFTATVKRLVNYEFDFSIYAYVNNENYKTDRVSFDITAPNRLVYPTGFYIYVATVISNRWSRFRHIDLDSDIIEVPLGGSFKLVPWVMPSNTTDLETYIMSDLTWGSALITGSSDKGSGYYPEFYPTNDSTDKACLITYQITSDRTLDLINMPSNYYKIKWELSAPNDSYDLTPIVRTLQPIHVVDITFVSSDGKEYYAYTNDPNDTTLINYKPFIMFVDQFEGGYGSYVTGTFTVKIRTSSGGFGNFDIEIKSDQNDYPYTVRLLSSSYDATTGTEIYNYSFDTRGMVDQDILGNNYITITNRRDDVLHYTSGTNFYKYKKLVDFTSETEIDYGPNG